MTRITIRRTGKPCASCGRYRPAARILKQEGGPTVSVVRPAGTVTPFHHDLTNNFMAQVKGAQAPAHHGRLRGCARDNQRHFLRQSTGATSTAALPADGRRAGARMRAGAGRVLFLPVGCWHFVERSTSMTVAFTTSNGIRFYASIAESRLLIVSSHA